MMRIVFLVTLLAALVAGCKKKSENRYVCKGPVACPAIFCAGYWSQLQFNLIDRSTGIDRLFGPNPSLQPSDIKLYSKKNSPYTQVPFLWIV